MLALFSGILIAWEYVGVQIGRSNLATLKTPVTDTPVTLSSPEVIPNVIISLILYFLVRLLIEWSISSKDLRRQAPAQLDLGLAVSLSLIAIGLFIIQTTTGIRLADMLTPYAFSGLVVGTTIMTYPGYVFYRDNIFYSRGVTEQNVYELINSFKEKRTSENDVSEAITTLIEKRKESYAPYKALVGDGCR